jgi:integrase
MPPEPPPFSARSKYMPLLENSSVLRWYKNVARGAQTTADIYLRRLGSFCNQMKTTPSQLLKVKPKRIHSLLLDFIDDEEQQGKAGSFIETSIKAVRSWLDFNGVQMTYKVKIRGARQTPTLQDERVPTQDELRRILHAAIPKDRCSCVLMAHSGLRPEVLGNYLGTDGLRIKDFSELRIQGKDLAFETIPTLVTVRPELSKSRRQYFTFLSEEGCEYLVEYLKERMQNDEVLNGDSDIIAPKVRTKAFIRSINIGDGVRKAIRTAGFKWRPYVLRAYFDTQLLLAESKGKITHPYRQFFMGHIGDIEARYTTNKGRLPKDLIEDMREAYKRCQPYLQTTKAGAGEEELKASFRRQLLLLTGMKEDEMDKLNINDMTDEEIQDILKRRLPRAIMNNGNRQKVVPTEEVETFITQGWEFVNVLPNAKAIIRLPS